MTAPRWSGQLLLPLTWPTRPLSVVFWERSPADVGVLAEWQGRPHCVLWGTGEADLVDKLGDDRSLVTEYGHRCHLVEVDPEELGRAWAWVQAWTAWYQAENAAADEHFARERVA